MSRNVVFDEVSLWWFSQATLLPYSKEIKVQMQKQMEVQPKVKETQPTQEEISKDEPSLGQGRVKSLDKEKSPWQIGIHTRSPKKVKPSEVEKLEEEVSQL